MSTRNDVCRSIDFYSSSSALLRFLVYPVPRGREEMSSTQPPAIINDYFR